MRMSELVSGFRQTCFAPICRKLDQAHRPGNTIIEVASLLNPLDLSMALAEGADECEARFSEYVGRGTHGALARLVSDTEAAAKRLGVEWVQVCEAIIREAERSTLARLVSYEADAGKVIGRYLLAERMTEFQSGIVGRVLGALAGMAVEEIAIARRVRQIDEHYEQFIAVMRQRFDEGVVPAIANDSRR